MVFITFFQMFWEAGLGKALIQTKLPLETAANVVFWINLATGTCIYLIFLIGAPLAGVFFNSPDCIPVLRVLGLQAIILSLTSVQQNLLMKEMDFRVIFWARLLSSFIPALVAIPLAIFNFGVWALVAGTLSGSFCFMLVLWVKSPWRPQLRFDIAIAKQLIRFGMWVILESFGAWLIMSGDNAIVGHYMGVDDMGIYTVAWTISSVVFGMIVTPALQVAFPAFAMLQDNRQDLRRSFVRTIRLIASLSIPVGMGLLCAGREISLVFFGSKWLGLGFVMGMIGILNGISIIFQSNRELYNAIGRPDLNTVVLASCLVIYVPAYLVAAPYGLTIFTYTRLGVSIFVIPIHIYVCARVINIKISEWITMTWSPLLASGLMVAAIFISRTILFNYYSLLPDWTVLICLIACGIISYTSAMMAIDRPTLIELLTIIRKAVRS